MKDLAGKTGNKAALCLAKALDAANGKFLDNDKSPQRKAGELDNRGSHFYLALYWAQALAAQSDDAGMRAKFAPIAAELARAEAKIVGELSAAQGKAVDIGGYYHPDSGKCGAAMRPSGTFNRILATLG